MIFPFVFSVPNALVNTKCGFEISSMQRSLILLPDIERRADGSHFTKSSLKKKLFQDAVMERKREMVRTMANPSGIVLIGCTCLHFSFIVSLAAAPSFEVSAEGKMIEKDLRETQSTIY